MFQNITPFRNSDIQQLFPIQIQFLKLEILDFPLHCLCLKQDLNESIPKTCLFFQCQVSAVIWLPNFKLPKIVPLQHEKH